MIKLKNILLKEEMSSKDKQAMKSSVRNIDFHIGYINGEIKKLVKMLNKEGMKKSSRELELSFKKKILDFQKDIKNISVQHLEEDFPGITNVGAGYSNKEAQKFSVDAVNKAAKEIGKAQNRAVSIFTSDMKNKKYDNMDLARSIKQGNIRDASMSKRDLLGKLYYDVRDRFNKYNRRKKN
jgi:hypothetical protein|tara:strand:+ start:76 stop:618 length:543 start_codon:yes stop_codon:yes gene_type:complete